MFNKPLYLEADIVVSEATPLLREKASSIIALPKEDEKQIDLMYFTALFVSSGANLNDAFFEPMELVTAEKTIINKALDIEHQEKDIIGHLYDRVFIDENGSVLDIEDLKKLDKEELNNMNMHIAVAGIVYKNRFPEIAKDIADKKWKVSMEAYYSDFDLKIGSFIMTRKEAESLGFVQNASNVIGKTCKVIKEGKEIASGVVQRILRNITFSGCGIVENPANPPSIILEVASHDKTNIKDTDTGADLIFNYDKLDNKLTSSLIDTDNKEVAGDPVIVHNDTIGICVNYKRRVEDKEGNITNEDWCSKFDTKCTASSREATDVDCLINKIEASIRASLSKRTNIKKIDRLIEDLNTVLDKINK